MKGNNELHLNTATVMEALQMWLDSKMPNCAPVVMGVTLSSRVDGTFVVPVSERDDRPGADKR